MRICRRDIDPPTADQATLARRLALNPPWSQETFDTLEDIAGESEVKAVAGRIAVALRAPVPLQGREVIVHISIGIAVSGSQADAKALLHEADPAL